MPFSDLNYSQLLVFYFYKNMAFIYEANREEYSLLLESFLVKVVLI